MVDRYSSSSKGQENPDCLGCRLSGGFVFIAIGCYLASLGRGRPVVSEKYGYFLLSSGKRINIDLL